jgi:hypothetical protein
MLARAGQLFDFLAAGSPATSVDSDGTSRIATEHALLLPKRGGLA